MEELYSYVQDNIKIISNIMKSNIKDIYQNKDIEFKYSKLKISKLRTSHYGYKLYYQAKDYYIPICMYFMSDDSCICARTLRYANHDNIENLVKSEVENLICFHTEYALSTINEKFLD